MAIRVLKSVPSAQSVVKKLFASFEQLFAVLYLFSGAHHPFGGRVQRKISVLSAQSVFKKKSSWGQIVTKKALNKMMRLVRGK